jgi:hypothetical protein
MENGPTPPQLARRETAKKLLASVENGEVTSMEGLDPRDTSSETLAQVRRLLRDLGHLAGTNSRNRL